MGVRHPRACPEDAGWDFDGRCNHCGQRAHCAQCGVASSSYGCYASDDDGGYFSCQEPERHERKRAKMRAASELKRRQQETLDKYRQEWQT